MKKYHLKIIPLFLLTVFLFFSCDDKLFEEEPTVQSDKYLVEFEQDAIISKLVADGLFAGLGALYPEIPAVADIASKTEFDIKVLKIKYKTVLQGDTVIASGLVCLPLGTEEFPILSYQNGTNTLHANAPSVASSDSERGQLYQFLKIVASTGYVITIPDYIGFGETENLFHPYLDKESTVQCVLDMLRATEELCENHNIGSKLNGDLYIAGYSMGGWATLNIQKTLETEFPELFNLRASACSAGPYELLYINNHILSLETYPMPYFLGFMIDSYTKLGDITIDISEIVNEPYASRIPLLFDGTKNGDEINEQLTTSVSELLTQEYRDGFLTDENFQSVRLTLLNNSVTAWDITTPTALLHGEDDVFVTPLVSENLYQDFINLGVSENLIQLALFPGIDHPQGIVPCSISSIKWFLDIKDAQ